MESFKAELNEWCEIYTYIMNVYDTIMANKEHYDVNGYGVNDCYQVLYNKIFKPQVNGRLQDIHMFTYSHYGTLKDARHDIDCYISELKHTYNTQIKFLLESYND